MSAAPSACVRTVAEISKVPSKNSLLFSGFSLDFNSPQSYLNHNLSWVRTKTPTASGTIRRFNDRKAVPFVPYAVRRLGTRGVSRRRWPRRRPPPREVPRAEAGRQVYREERSGRTGETRRQPAALAVSSASSSSRSASGSDGASRTRASSRIPSRAATEYEFESSYPAAAMTFS